MTQKARQKRDRFDYNAYLKSAAWREKRVAVLDRAHGMCEQPDCNSKARQVHHKTYESIGDEPLEDLLALCVPCHQLQHPDKFPSAAAASKHQKNRKGKRNSVPCHICGKMLANEFGRRQHLTDKHGVDAPIPDRETLVARRQAIKDLRTPKGGYTRKALASVGVPWPPPKGWRRRIVENGIPYREAA